MEGEAQEHAHVRLLLAAAVAGEHFIEPVEDGLQLLLLAVKQPCSLTVRARALRKGDGITGKVDIYGVDSVPIHVENFVRLERFIRRMEEIVADPAVDEVDHLGACDAGIALIVKIAAYLKLEGVLGLLRVIYGAAAAVGHVGGDLRAFDVVHLDDGRGFCQSVGLEVIVVRLVVYALAPGEPGYLAGESLRQRGVERQIIVPVLIEPDVIITVCKAAVFNMVKLIVAVAGLDREAHDIAHVRQQLLGDEVIKPAVKAVDDVFVDKVDLAVAGGHVAAAAELRLAAEGEHRLLAAAGGDRDLTYRITQPVLRERGGLVYRAFGADAADGAHHAVETRPVKRKIRIVIGVPCAVVALKAQAAGVLEAQGGHGIGVEREHGGAFGIVTAGIQLRVQLRCGKGRGAYDDQHAEEYKQFLCPFHLRLLLSHTQTPVPRNSAGISQIMTAVITDALELLIVRYS